MSDEFDRLTQELIDAVGIVRAWGINIQVIPATRAVYFYSLNAKEPSVYLRHHEADLVALREAVDSMNFYLQLTARKTA